MGENPSTGDDETASSGPLTARELDVLEFAALRWRHLGAMESEVRTRFGWTLTRYHQVLAALTDRPEAAAHNPQLIARLTRPRETRRRARTHGADSQVHTTATPRNASEKPGVPTGAQGCGCV